MKNSENFEFSAHKVVVVVAFVLNSFVVVVCHSATKSNSSLSKIKNRSIPEVGQFLPGILNPPPAPSIKTDSKQPVPPADPKFVERYATIPFRPTHYKLVSNIFKLIFEHGLFFEDVKSRQTGSYNYRNESELKELIDIPLGETGVDDDQLLRILKNVIQYSPHPAHPYMLDKRMSGLDPYSLAGDWLAAAMNVNVVTFLVSPVASIMEIEMVKALSNLIGWDKKGQGTPCPGEGYANSMGMSLAIGSKYSEFKNQGLIGRTRHPLIFISEHASYAYHVIAKYQGLAQTQIIRIKTDSYGRMDLMDLKKKINRWVNDTKYMPVSVVGTAGTQVLGQIDDLKGIAAICKIYNLWFHVDAAKGGGLLFKTGELKGIEKADSVTFGTWMFSTPYVTSMLLTKNNTALQNSFGLHAKYVFTGQELYNMSYDTGDSTVQTSRRPEITKLWFMWIGRGKTGLINHVKKIEKLKDLLVQKLRAKPTVFVPVLQNFDLPLVSFYVVPRNVDRNDFDALATESVRIQKNLIKNNLLFVSLSTLPSLESNYATAKQVARAPMLSLPKYFLTISLTNSQLREPDLDYILNVIEMTANQDADGIRDIKPPAYKNDGNEKFANSPTRKSHENFLKKVASRILNTGLFFKRSDNVTKFKKPEELLKLIDFTLPDDAMSEHKLLTLVDQVIEYSPHWAHPYFIYQLAAGLDPYSVIADIIAPVLNSPMISYKDSPVFTMMENELLGKIRGRVFGSDKGDGIITDGGSLGNQMAIQLAKYAKKDKLNHVHRTGIRGNQKLIVFLSEDGHYSTKKGAIIQSLGSDSIVPVRANDKGQMDVIDLIAKIQSSLKCGDIPFMVVITTGTTIYGAIDPIEEIVKVCKKYDLWCHVDGMFGGFMVMSNKHKDATPGLFEVDSWGADVHKLLGSAYVCTVLITRHDGIFRKALAVDPNFLSSDFPIRADIEKSNGIKHLQTEKRNNMLKLWTMWKAKGQVGLGNHVDTIMENSKYILAELNKRKDRGFLPVLNKFELTNICFYYIPPSVRNLQVNSEEWKKAMDAVSFEIETQMVKRNIMTIVSQSHHSEVNGDTPNFIKFVMMGSALTHEDINYLLDMIEFIGKTITVPVIQKSFSRHVQHPGIIERFEPFGNMPNKEIREQRFKPRSSATVCKSMWICVPEATKALTNYYLHSWIPRLERTFPLFEWTD